MRRSFKTFTSSSLAVLVIPLWLVGCPVDDRILVADDAGTGGRGSGRAGRGGAPVVPSEGGEAGMAIVPQGGDGGTSGAGGTAGLAGAPTGGAGMSAGTAGAAGAAGSTGSAGAAGAAGGGGMGAGATAQCPDIDFNGTVDCDETAVENPDFDADADQWDAESFTTVTWNAVDAREVSSSGSMDIINQNVGDHTSAVLAAASQCVNVYAGRKYLFAAEIFVPEGQVPGGFGALGIAWFPEPNCTGAYIENASGFAQSSSNNFWQTVRLTKAAPPGAVSASVRLGSVKALDKPPYTARFDNVLFREQPEDVTED